MVKKRENIHASSFRPGASQTSFSRRRCGPSRRQPAGSVASSVSLSPGHPQPIRTDGWKDGAPLLVTQQGRGGGCEGSRRSPTRSPSPLRHTSEPRALPGFPFPPSGSRSLPPCARLSPTAVLTSLLPHPSVSSMVRGVREVPVVGSGGAPSPSQDRRGRTWTQLHPVLPGFRGLRSHSAR